MSANPAAMLDCELAMVSDRLSRAADELEAIAKKPGLGAETSRALQTARTFAQSAEMWAAAARGVARVRL